MSKLADLQIFDDIEELQTKNTKFLTHSKFYKGPQQSIKIKKQVKNLSQEDEELFKGLKADI